jgi:hypothetical protein
VPPAVWFAYTEDRKGEHPRRHLSSFSGILQADGYAGFHHLYKGGRITEAACWAHVRRKFYDIQLLTVRRLLLRLSSASAHFMTSNARSVASLPIYDARSARREPDRWSKNSEAG